MDQVRVDAILAVAKAVAGGCVFVAGILAFLF